MKQDNRNREDPSLHRRGEPGDESFVPESFSADYRGTSSLPLRADAEQEAKVRHEAEEAEEMDKELDDFLPEGESLPEEEFLTKWSRDLENDEEEPVDSHASLEEAEEGMAVAKTALRQRRPQGRRWYGLLVGSLVLLLALTGVGFLAWMAGSSLHARLTDDSQLRAYDDFLTPVVMLDPEPFASPDKAPNTFVQEASLWKAILDDGGSRYTQYDDNGRVIIPLGDVASACVALFGPDRNLSPGTPSEESFYTYDERITPTMWPFLAPIVWSRPTQRNPIQRMEKPFSVWGMSPPQTNGGRAVFHPVPRLLPPPQSIWSMFWRKTRIQALLIYMPCARWRNNRIQ